MLLLRLLLMLMLQMTIVVQGLLVLEKLPDDAVTHDNDAVSLLP